MDGNRYLVLHVGGWVAEWVGGWVGGWVGEVVDGCDFV